MVANLPLSFTQNTNCTHPDYPALTTLYTATNGPNWVEKWDLSDCDVCNYPGISCNAQNRVAEIALENNNLTGSIPPEIGLLDQLENLNLSQNNLTSEIPKEIGNLTKLFIAFLGDNELSGSIPAEIGQLINTQFIVLSNNQLSGNLPPTLKNFGSQRTALTMPGGINVANNQLTGCYPEGFGVFCVPNFSLITEGNIELSDFSQYCENSIGICEEEMSPMSCDSLQFKTELGQIIVSGLTTSSKVEIIGRNTDYQVITICDGNCSNRQLIPHLAAGEYTVKVNLFDGVSYCYREAAILVESDEENNKDKANCDKLVFTAGDGAITIDGLTAQYNKVEIIGHNTDWQVITICDGDCSPTLLIPVLLAGEYNVKINQAGADGSYCYREEKIIIESESNAVGSVNCEGLIFLNRNDSIIIDGLTASYNKVEILGRNTNWQVVTICDGDCSSTQIIPDLQAGAYAVKINQGGNDGIYCYREEQVSIENNSSNRNKEIDFGNNLVLFPNPARDRINLQLASLSGKQGSIQIYNAFGQMVQSFPETRFDREVVSIDLDRYENGIYLMIIQVDKFPLVSRRFVVEHLK